MVTAGAKKCGLSTSTEFWALLETGKVVQPKIKHESSRRERNFYLWTRPLRGKSKRHDRYSTDAAKKPEAAQNLAKPSCGVICAVHPFTASAVVNKFLPYKPFGRHLLLEYSESIPATSLACN
jgi:hypothetical protein